MITRIEWPVFPVRAARFGGPPISCRGLPTDFPVVGYREAFARGLHRFLHFGRFVRGIRASLVLRVRAEAAMPGDMTENNCQFIIGQSVHGVTCDPADVCGL
jgi:hypothetical protein